MSELLSVIDSYAAADVAAMPSPAQPERLEELLAAERRLQAEIARSLHVARAKDVTVGECGLQTRSWLIAEAGLTPADAGRRTALARQVAGFPRVADAWATGDIGEAHVRALVRALGELPAEHREAAQDILLPLARSAPPAALGVAIGELRGRLGLDGDDHAAWVRRQGQRHLHAAATFGGMVAITGLLDPLAGQALFTALHATRPAGSEDARTTAQRHADTLGEIVGHWLACADLPDAGGERPRLVLTVDFDTLAGACDPALLSTGAGRLSAAALRRLACDAEILPAVLGGASQLLDLGRTSRTWTLAQRRAVTARDGYRCAHGHCSNRPADLHHVVWWSRGGATDIANGVWLCAFHHWLVHDGGWALTRDDATSTVTFTGPGGHQYRFRRGRPA